MLALANPEGHLGVEIVIKGIVTSGLGSPSAVQPDIIFRPAGSVESHNRLLTQLMKVEIRYPYSLHRGPPTVFEGEGDLSFGVDVPERLVALRFTSIEEIRGRGCEELHHVRPELVDDLDLAQISLLGVLVGEGQQPVERIDVLAGDIEGLTLADRDTEREVEERLKAGVDDFPQLIKLPVGEDQIVDILLGEQRERREVVFRDESGITIADARLVELVDRGLDHLDMSIDRGRREVADRGLLVYPGFEG